MHTRYVRFISRYPSCPTLHFLCTIALIHSPTSSARGPAASPRSSTNRCTSSSWVTLKAPEPGAEPLTMASTAASEGSPYLRKRPHVESDLSLPLLDRLGGLKMSCGRADCTSERESKKLLVMFAGEMASSEIEEGDHDGRSADFETSTAVTPVMKSSVARLGPYRSAHAKFTCT